MKHTSISHEEFFFYLYFIIMVGAKGLGFINGSVEYKVCIVIAMLFLALKLLVGKYCIAEYVVIALLLFLCTYIWHITGNQCFFICISLVVAFKGISAKKAFGIGAFIWTLAFIIQIITQLLNIRTRDFVIHNKYGLGYIIRWALGYSHPNVLQISYAIMIMYLFFVFRPLGKRLVKSIVISTLGACYIFMYSLSTTGMLLYVMFIFFVLIFELRREHGIKKGKISKILLKSIFPLSVGFSVFAPALLSGKTFEIADRLMTTRLSLSRKFYNDYGLSLFGKNFTGLPASVTLDCSYTRLLIYGGAVLFIIVCVGYILMINDAVNEENSSDNSFKLAIIFCTVIAGISEPFMFNESFKNLTLIFIGEWFFTKVSKWETNSNTYCIIKSSNVSIPIMINRNKVLEEIVRMKDSIRLITVIALLCATMGTVFYSFSVDLPDRVYALRTSCDTDDNSESVYLTEEEVSEFSSNDDVLILNYKDSKTALLCFSGRIIEIEYIRGMISSFVWGGIAAILISFIYCYIWLFMHTCG